jgi:hypothetical protein
MARHPNQTTGFNRPLTPRAQQLLARSRNVPTGAPLKRHWIRTSKGFAENCNECGRIIEPRAERYADQVSGHLVRHVGCHEKAEGKR